MKRTRVLSACLCLVIGSWLHAQERRAGGPPYDSANEVTISAVVVGVDTFTPPDGQARAVLNVTVDGKPVAILLGPQEWFAGQKFNFDKGSTVQVTGLTGARMNSLPAMLPRLVKSGTRTLTVRNPKGLPVWEGGLTR